MTRPTCIGHCYGPGTKKVLASRWRPFDIRVAANPRVAGSYPLLFDFSPRLMNNYAAILFEHARRKTRWHVQRFPFRCRHENEIIAIEEAAPRIRRIKRATREEK